MEGIHDEEEKKKIRTELVNGKWPSEMLSKRRRKMYKRKREGRVRSAVKHIAFN